MVNTKEKALKVVEDWEGLDYERCTDDCGGPTMHADLLAHRVHRAMLEIKLEVLERLANVTGVPNMITDVKTELAAIPCEICHNKPNAWWNREACYHCGKTFQ